MNEIRAVTGDEGMLIYDGKDLKGRPADEWMQDRQRQRDHISARLAEIDPMIEALERTPAVAGTSGGLRVRAKAELEARRHKVVREILATEDVIEHEQRLAAYGDCDYGLEGAKQRLAALKEEVAAIDGRRASVAAEAVAEAAADEEIVAARRKRLRELQEERDALVSASRAMGPF